MPFTVAALIFLSIYVVFASLYVIFTAHYVIKIRYLTKPFLMVFLILAVLFTTYEYTILIAGLIFDLIGDIMLLNRKSNKVFVLGGLCFFVGHILYNVQLIVLLATKTNYFDYPLGYVLTAVEFVVFLVLTTLLAKYRYRLSGKLMIIVSLYFAVLFLLTPLAINLVIQSSLWSLFILFGVILFAISDVIIFVSKFKRPHLKYRNFLVAITYALAQLLIVVGMILIL